MQNLVAVAHPVCACRRCQKFTGHQGPAAANSKGMSDPRKTLSPHMCYCTKFGRCRSNRLGMGMGPKSLGTRGLHPLKWGVSDPTETRSSSTCYHCKSMSNWWCVITEIHRKSLALRDQTLKVTETYTHWSNVTIMFIRFDIIPA